MPQIKYNISELEQIGQNFDDLQTEINSAGDDVINFFRNIDSRVAIYHNMASDWGIERVDLSNYKSNEASEYFNGKVSELKGGSFLPTAPEVKSDTPESTSGPSGTETPDKGTTQKVKIDDLTPNEHDVVIEKLKQAGYTDEEIENIKNGKISVPKKVLDQIAGDIKKAGGSGNEELRQAILKKYGIDIFNEDGSIDYNKLALIKLIDDKNPDDDYDINKLIAQYLPSPTSPTTTPSTNPNTTSPSTVTVNPNTTAPTTEPQGHTGQTYTGAPVGPVGDTTGGSTEQAAIEEIINGNSKPNGKEGSLIDGIVTSFGKIIPKGGISGSEGSSAGGAATAVVAGLGAAAVAAGGGLLIKKKMDENGEDEDEKEDDELEKEENEFDEEMKQMEEDKEDSGNRDWLYGLGIGLAGAGIAAGLMNDDDDDDDEEEDDEIDLL